MKKTRISPRDFSGRSRPRSRNHWSSLFSSQRFIAIVLLVFLVIIILPLIRTYRQHKAVQEEIRAVQNKINSYQAQDEKFQQMLTYLKSDQYSIDQARLNLNMKKPGEGVVVVDKQQNMVTSTTAATSSQVTGNLIKWWRYFFD